MQDDNALEAKKQELIRLVSKNLPTDDDKKDITAEKVVSAFCELTPPEFSAVIYNISLSNKGFGGGSSRKPGNILLNWKNLFRTIPSTVLTATGAVAVPWLWPFAALVIWHEIWSQAKINLSQRHAVAIHGMWTNVDEDRNISEDRAFLHINKLLEQYNYPKMIKKEFAQILNDLNKMDCIERSDDGNIWMREWVKDSYS